MRYSRITRESGGNEACQYNALERFTASTNVEIEEVIYDRGKSAFRSGLNKRSVLYEAKRKIKYCKAQARAKVEYPFRVIKRQLGYVKVRFRGLMKNNAQLNTLFALSNLWMARKNLLSMGKLRTSYGKMRANALKTE